MKLILYAGAGNFLPAEEGSRDHCSLFFLGLVCCLLFLYFWCRPWWGVRFLIFWWVYFALGAAS